MLNSLHMAKGRVNGSIIRDVSSKHPSTIEPSYDVSQRVPFHGHRYRYGILCVTQSDFSSRQNMPRSHSELTVSHRLDLDHHLLRVVGLSENLGKSNV